MPPFVAVASNFPTVVFRDAPLDPTAVPVAVRVFVVVISSPAPAVIAPEAVSDTAPVPALTGPFTLRFFPVPPVARVTPVPVTADTVIVPVLDAFTGPLAALAVRATLPVCCR